MTAPENKHGATQWLTKNYLENMLQKYKNDKCLKILALEIRPALPKGENYASVLTRVKLNYEGTAKIPEVLTFIVKTSHAEDPFIAELYKSYQIYKTEMAMYETVLPSLSALLKKIGDYDKLFANTIHVDHENEAIIFEDLAVHDFRVADRIAGMDMEHTKLALRKLAKMHATAAVYNTQTKGSLEKYKRGLFNRHTRGLSCFVETILEVCANFAGDCPELGQHYKEKLLKLKARIVEYATRATDERDGDFHTLVHGDYWINNMMVRYQEQPQKNGCTNSGSSYQLMIKDLLMIDFQFCSWTSPAIDLHYFFNTSLEGHIRLHRQDELVQYYHGILYETLVKLNYAGHKPTLHEFWIQMEARRFYAVPSALVQQTIIISENAQDADIQALILDDERARKFRRMLYENKVVQENTKNLLPLFDKHGLLDVID